MREYLVSKLLLFAPNLLGMQQGLLAADSAFIAGLYQNLLKSAETICLPQATQGRFTELLEDRAEYSPASDTPAAPLAKFKSWCTPYNCLRSIV